MEFLNVGLGELLFIFVIALVVLGPERMPELARRAGELFGQLRNVSDELTRAMMSETEPIRKTLNETRQEIEGTVKPLDEVRADLQAGTRALNDASRTIEKEVRGAQIVGAASARTTGAVATPAADADLAAAESGEAARATPEQAEALIREPAGYKPISRGEVNDGDDRE